MDIGFLLDLHHLMLLPLELLLLQLHVAATLVHDVGGSFAGFVDLAHGLWL
jgi:hypothetical protein